MKNAHLAGNLRPEVHRRTGLFGFKREFGRFLSISTFGGGLSFKGPEFGAESRKRVACDSTAKKR
jgi:hypothetical protein